MSQFVILNLLGGFSSKKFSQIFKSDIFNIFKDELKFLLSNSIIRKKGSFLKYDGNWSMGSLFEYFAYTKIFYEQDILLKLKNKFSNIYNPNHVYDFHHDGFLRKIEDPFFLLALNKSGF
jgi:hypothetical protein